MSLGQDVWPSNAHHWHLLGSPLRPSAEDVRVVARAAETLAVGSSGPLRALILGVTPELATLRWPEGTSLVAIDRSEPMIRAVWPSSGLPAGARVERADWRAMPFADASFDLVAGDGVYSALVQGDYAAFTGEVRRVLRPGGAFVVRAFVAPPGERETIAHVAGDLWAGRIGSIHAFKWRLAMALQPSLGEGVRLADVWNAWREVCPRPDELAAAHAWDLATVRALDAYRGVETRYTFPTLSELRAEVDGSFDERACHVPGYELGERCPTLDFTRS